MGAPAGRVVVRADHPLPATTLEVDGENELARRLYDKAGMRVVQEFRRWERPV